MVDKKKKEKYWCIWGQSLLLRWSDSDLVQIKQSSSRLDGRIDGWMCIRGAETPSVVQDQQLLPHQPCETLPVLSDPSQRLAVFTHPD